MDYGFLLLFKSVVMGIVEGITEFLPISSTGHLIIAGEVIDFPKEFGKVFDVVIQLGAIVAVVYFFRKKILNSLKMLKKDEWGFLLWMNIIIAFLPSALIGFGLHKYIEMLFSATVVSWAMIVGAILLYFAQRVFSKSNIEKVEDITIGKSLIIGFAQCLALIPGMSRSASTIMGGMVAGLNVKTAAEFSFFLAIPTMFAASAYSFIKGFSVFEPIQIASLGVGFIISFLVALLVVGKFMDYLGKRSLDVFVYYRLIAGVALLILINYGIIK